MNRHRSPTLGRHLLLTLTGLGLAVAALAGCSHERDAPRAETARRMPAIPCLKSVEGTPGHNAATAPSAGQRETDTSSATPGEDEGTPPARPDVGAEATPERLTRRGHLCDWDRNCGPELVCQDGLCVEQPVFEHFTTQFTERARADEFGAPGLGSVTPKVLVTAFCHVADHACTKRVASLSAHIGEEDEVRVVMWVVFDPEKNEERLFSLMWIKASMVDRFFEFRGIARSVGAMESGERAEDYMKRLDRALDEQSRMLSHIFLEEDGRRYLTEEHVRMERVSRQLGLTLAPKLLVNGIELDIDVDPERLKALFIQEQLRAQSVIASGVPDDDVVHHLIWSNNAAFASIYYPLLRGGASYEQFKRLRHRKANVRVRVKGERRHRPLIFDGDWVRGSKKAPITVVALVEPGDIASAQVHEAVKQLRSQTSATDVRLVLRPYVEPIDAAAVRRARLVLGASSTEDRLHALDLLLQPPSGTTWSGVLDRLAPGFGSMARLVQRANSRETSERIRRLLQEQVRLDLREAPAVYVNGRLVPSASRPTAIAHAVAKERAALEARQGTKRRRPDYAGLLKRYKSADAIGETAHRFPTRDAIIVGEAEDTALATLTLFIDYQCPFSRQMIDLIQSLSLELPGKLRLVLLNYPMDKHPLATELAGVAICAARQGRYRETLGVLLGAQAGKDHVDYAALCEAAAIKDCAALEDCAGGEEVLKQIKREQQAGRDAEVAGTPALFVDGRKLTPQGEGFSSPLVLDLLTGYFMRDWVLPTESMVQAPKEVTR
jgi:protein-disulfide isomerase